MSNNTPNSSNNPKKARLGRGLGSLLGNNSDLSEKAPAVTPPATKASTDVPRQPPAGASAHPEGTAAKAVPSQTSQTNQPTQKPVASQTAVSTATVASSATETKAATPATAPIAAPLNEMTQIWRIPVDRLVPNTQQPRRTFTPEHLKDLAASVKEHGILQPITARRLSEKQFEIIAGERRWRAAQAAGLHEVPVTLKKVTEQHSLELAIIENIQRENLNPLEEAEAFENLLNDYSLTQQQIAEKLGKERSTIANALRLLSLPTEVRELVRRAELSAGHAKVILGLESPKAQIEVAKQVVEDKLSVRATEKLVAKSKTDSRLQPGPQSQSQSALNVDVSQRLINSLSAELQKLIGTKVAIDYSGGKGKLNISFYTDDQLTQLVEKIRRSWEK